MYFLLFRQNVPDMCHFTFPQTVSYKVSLNKTTTLLHTKPFENIAENLITSNTKEMQMKK